MAAFEDAVNKKSAVHANTMALTGFWIPPRYSTVTREPTHPCLCRTWLFLAHRIVARKLLSAMWLFNLRWVQVLRPDPIRPVPWRSAHPQSAMH